MAEPAQLYPSPLRSLTRAQSEELAIHVLGWIAAGDWRVRDFLKISGLQPETIRKVAGSPVFLLGVLDYLAGDEALLRAFAIETEMHPATVMAARAALAPSKPAVERRLAGPLRLRCEHCGVTEIRQRRDHPHVPAAVVTIVVARCGDCGGAAGGPETWLDVRGNEVG
jgi:hypothetical protein